MRVEPGRLFSRLSPRVDKKLDERRFRLESIGLRHGRSIRVHAALLNALRGKDRFFIRGTTAWNLTTAERDMVVIDLASVAISIYESGGLLSLLRGKDELAALARTWEHETHEDIKDDVFREVQQRRFVEWRHETFQRLFPDCTSDVATNRDVHRLTDRFREEMKPLEKDRSTFRAHRFERTSEDHLEKFGTANALSPTQITDYYDKCVRLLRDVFALATSAHWGAYEILEPESDDAEAKSVVDLILFGTAEMVHAETRDSKQPYLWQRRTELLDELHAEHDKHGAPESIAFNAPEVMQWRHPIGGVPKGAT